VYVGGEEQFLLLTVENALRETGNKLDFQAVAKSMGSTRTPKAIQQHLAKIRRTRLINAQAVPPMSTQRLSKVSAKTRMSPKARTPPKFTDKSSKGTPKTSKTTPKKRAITSRVLRKAKDTKPDLVSYESDEGDTESDLDSDYGKTRSLHSASQKRSHKVTVKDVSKDGDWEDADDEDDEDDQERSTSEKTPTKKQKKNYDTDIVDLGGRMGVKHGMKTVLPKSTPTKKAKSRPLQALPKVLPRSMPKSSNAFDPDETESDIGHNDGIQPSAPPNSPAGNIFQQVMSGPTTIWESSSLGHPVGILGGSYTYNEPLTGNYFNEAFGPTTVSQAYQDQPIRSIFHQHQYGLNQVGNVQFYGTIPVPDTAYHAIGLTPPVRSMYDAAGYYVGPENNFSNVMPLNSNIPGYGYSIGAANDLPSGGLSGDSNFYFRDVPVVGSIDELLQNAARVEEVEEHERRNNGMNRQ